MQCNIGYSFDCAFIAPEKEYLGFEISYSQVQQLLRDSFLTFRSYIYKTDEHTEWNKKFHYGTVHLQLSPEDRHIGDVTITNVVVH